ncbi:hypothetical protein H1R20_g8371, partial [Candolleomyces eurysporus]
MILRYLFTFYCVALGLSGEAFGAPIQGEASLEKRQAGQLITRCTVPNTVGMSFDDGPYNYLHDIVNTLKANNATATFFFSGDNWNCIYNADAAERVQYAYNNGMHVASHTWRHGDLATMNWDLIHDEMWRVEQALLKIVGAYPAFMRPPYGSYNSLVLEAARVRGQAVVTWDFDSQDSMGASAQQSINLYQQKIQQHPSTILPLNHETYCERLRFILSLHLIDSLSFLRSLASTAYTVLPAVLPKLKAAGYRVVDVATSQISMDDRTFTKRLFLALLVCGF